MRDALATIRAEGIPAVFLKTDENDDSAESFYPREGLVGVAPGVAPSRLELR